MTQEDKNLLLKDLSARLTYGVKITWDGEYSIVITPLIFNGIWKEENSKNIPKPYLRSIDSMSEEEYDEVGNLLKATSQNLGLDEVLATIMDWLNAHHFDYRGLIEKGLAIAVTKENNPYKE